MGLQTAGQQQDCTDTRPWEQHFPPSIGTTITRGSSAQPDTPE